MPQQVIVLEFNELCPSLMDRFIDEGHLPGFKALRDQSTVFVTDAEEKAPNLEPWIQWVTVHTGLPYSEHKVFDLGDAHKLIVPRIWDIACEAGKSVWICGSMNATIKKPSDKTWFVPDPWSSEVKPFPRGEFDTFTDLAWRYVQEHTRESSPWSKRDYVNFLFYMLGHGLSMKTVWRALVQIVQDRRNKQLRWRRATILDRLQWDMFRHYWKKKRPDFATFFLNSTAHFQHFHWREMEPHLFTAKNVETGEHTKDAILVGYKAMDGIMKECLCMAPQATIILMTALSQQPMLHYEAVGGRVFFKPIDPAALMQFAGIKGTYKYAPVMSDEFRLYFENEAAAEQAEQALQALTINGKQIMRARRHGSEVFAGCDVKTPLARDQAVRSSTSSEIRTFGELFYQASPNLKSGWHHPDGIFWIRTPGVRPTVVAEKMPLTEAAHMLAGIVGVEFDHRFGRKKPPVPARA
jgi:hypothetical protein